MRQEFESELQAARSEVAKAQSALVGAEERVRSAEQVERARLEAGYQARVTALQAEVERMRQELAYRTSVMQSEMQRCAAGGGGGGCDLPPALGGRGMGVGEGLMGGWS